MPRIDLPRHLAELAVDFPTLKLTGTFVNKKVKCEYTCTVCGHAQLIRPDAVCAKRRLVACNNCAGSGKNVPLWRRLKRKCKRSKTRYKGTRCRLWTGSERRGYGRLKIKGKAHGVHVKSYESYYGPVPEGYNVCHHCDTPLCFHPLHLFAGTQSDNIRDMDRKGRRFINAASHTARF